MKKGFVFFVFCCLGSVDFSWGMKIETTEGEVEFFNEIDTIFNKLQDLRTSVNFFV